MGCTPVKLPDGATGIVCTSERRHRCDFCQRWAERQCDGPKVKRGRKSKTCDAWLCRKCTTSRPGQGDTVDLCPRCVPAAGAPTSPAAPQLQGVGAELAHQLQHASTLDELSLVGDRAKAARASGKMTGDQRAALGTLYLARRAALMSLAGAARPVGEIAKDYPDDTIQRLYARDEGPPGGLEKALTEALVTVRRGSYQPKLRPQGAKLYPCVDCGGMIGIYTEAQPPYRHGGFLLYRGEDPSWPNCEHGARFRMDCKGRPEFPPCCTRRKP